MAKKIQKNRTQNHQKGESEDRAGGETKASVCDSCENPDFWECKFCCVKCYEDFGCCPDEDCDPMDI